MKTEHPRSVALSLILFALLGLSQPARAVHTALDDYIAAPDSSYGWSLRSTAPMYGFDGAPPQLGTLYTLKMTSQTWQSGKTNPDRSKWIHWITIAKPYNAVSGACFLIIDGGSISATPPDISQYAAISAALGVTLAYLTYIPNEPLKFSDGISRTEDSIIAYTYDQYMDLYGTPNEDPTWPLLLPMVKGAVRGMDAVQEFLQQEESMTISDFIIGGASKRGWTTWLTAAVDPRVKAAVPIVIDILNMQKQLPHHKNAYSSYSPNDTAHHMYGGYSDAIKDYTQFDIFNRLPTTEGMALGQIVDPLAYRDRLTMPKLIINSTGDQFFLPDGIKFYYNQIPGENHILYVPNSDHSLSIDLEHPDMLLNILSFVAAFVPGSGVSLPKFDWSFQPDGSIRVVADQLPQEVNVWQAHVETNRDFRLENVGAIWSKSPLTDPDGDGVYVASVPAPPTGWTGFYVSVKVNGLETCSGLRIVPDTYPNAAPPADTWQPTFENFSAAPAALRTGETTTLSFQASEALAADPTVTVNGNPATLQSANGSAYTFAHTMLPGDPEGPANVKISGTDLAGNPGFSRYPNTLAVNNTPLSVTRPDCSLALAGAGTEVMLTFNASEPVHAVPAVSVNGHPALFSSLAGLAYEYAYTVLTEDLDGYADIQITAVDFAGETVNPSFGDVLMVDNTPPSFDSLVVSPASAKEGATVTLTLTASETLSNSPTVALLGLGGAALQSVAGDAYVFTYTVGASDPAGPVSVYIEGYDMLAHWGCRTFDSAFVIDRTAPSFSGLSAVPRTAREGVEVSMAFTATEPLSSAPGVSVNGNPATFKEDAGMASFVYSYSVQADDPDGFADIQVSGLDAAGIPGNAAFGDSLAVDNSPPSGTLSINAGAYYTASPTVTLACAAGDGTGSGIAGMRFSDDGLGWSGWAPFAPSTVHILPPAEGMRTVWVQYSDAVGNTSLPVSNRILLDTVPPTGKVLINNNRSATNKTDVALGLSWDDLSGSGVSRMRFSNDGATWTPWEPPVPTAARTLPGGGDGHKTVRVQYLDKAGNRSAACTDYILLDTTPPTGSILVNGGAYTTTGTDVTLTLTWADAGALVSRMRFSDNGSTWTAWEPPKAACAHMLPPGPGYHTVRVQYLDGANNYSAVYNDYIKLVAK